MLESGLQRHGKWGCPRGVFKKSNVLKFKMQDSSVVVRPSGTEPKLKTYISVTAENKEAAEEIESAITESLESIIK